MTMTNRDDLVEDVGADSDDGRRARRGRNRDAVVEAMLELYGEGNLAPSSDEIAQRAGLSPRSLFRYFDDIDDLARAAIDRQLARVLPVTPIDVDADASTAERITALVEQRARVFERIGNTGHVARMRAPFQPVVAEQLVESRAFFRHQIERLMAPELAAMSSKQASTALAAVDVLCSFEAYNLLRDDQGLSRTRAVGVLAASLTTLFVREA